MDQMSTY